MTRRHGRRGEQDLAREIDDLRDAVLTDDEFRVAARDPVTGDLLETTGEDEGEIVDPDALPADTTLIVIDEWLVMSRENAEKYDRTILEDVPDDADGVPEGRNLVRVLPYEDYRDEWPRGSGSGGGSAGAGPTSTPGPGADHNPDADHDPSPGDGADGEPDGERP